MGTDSADGRAWPKPNIEKAYYMIVVTVETIELYRVAA